MPKLGAPTKTQPSPDTWGHGASPEIWRFLQGPQPRRSELFRAVRIFIEFIRGFRDRFGLRYAPPPKPRWYLGER